MENVMTIGFCELSEREIMEIEGGATASHAGVFGSPLEKAAYNLEEGTNYHTGVYTFWDAFFNGGRIDR